MQLDSSNRAVAQLYPSDAFPFPPASQSVSASEPLDLSYADANSKGRDSGKPLEYLEVHNRAYLVPGRTSRGTTALHRESKPRLATLEAARAGIKNGRFIRMHRITRIIRIAPGGGMTPLARVGFFFVISQEKSAWRTKACPSGSSQKIPALVLRAVTRREAIPNNQPQSEASVLKLPFLMPAWPSLSAVQRRTFPSACFD